MQVFLSYHTPDRALAKRLKDAIETALPGSSAFFAEENQRPGGVWQELQSQRIQDCDAFLILVGAHAGEWQKLEYYEARIRHAADKRMLLLPIIIADRARESVANLPGLTLFHWIEATDPAAPEPLARILTALSSGQVAANPEPWRLVDPYRGLEALDEQDMDFFFGRETETGLVLERIAAARGRLVALIGNSGVGKSSLARAGVIGTLKAGRPAHGSALPAAAAAVLHDSRRWAYLAMTPGTDPFTALVHQFLRLWQFDPTDAGHARRLHDWVEQLRDGAGSSPLTLGDLIAASDDQLVRNGGSGALPQRYLLYVDQGEELHTRTPPAERERFSASLADALRRLPDRLTVLMSHRSDYYGRLQADAALFPLTDRIDVAPLSPAQMERALGEPARMLGARFETPGLVAQLVGSTRQQPDALPLLADLFQDLWRRMRARGDGVLRISDHPQLTHPGAALTARAEAFLQAHPDRRDATRRLFTLRLAEVPRVGEPLRAEMLRDDSTAEGRAEWSLAEELSGPQLRLLVTGEKDGQAKAWVAHEVLLRSWDRLAGWLQDEREFLVWKSEAEARHRSYGAAREADKPAALLMGLDLATARRWRDRRADDLGAALLGYVDASARAADRGVRQRRRLQGSVVSLMLMIIVGLLGYIFEQRLQGLWFRLRYGHPVSTEDALALGTGQSFLDCGDVTGEAGTSLAGYSAQCPEMVIVPASDVSVGRPFALSKFEVTAEQWDWCVQLGGCRAASGLGDRASAIVGVSWEDAQAYVQWLGRMTGRRYRLPTDAEWKYAATGGRNVPPAEAAIGRCAEANVADRTLLESMPSPPANLAFADCRDGQARSVLVGRYRPNAFGLHDLVGNAWEWVEDCFPTAGSAAAGDATRRDGCIDGVLRGGGWYTEAARATPREWARAPRDRREDQETGFRVARTL